MSDDLIPDLDGLPVEVDDSLPDVMPTEPWSEDGPNGVRYTYIPLGDGKILRKTEFIQTQDLIDQNHSEAMGTMNVRWRDGFNKIASIPVNVLYNDDGLSKALKEGDDAYLTRWLQNSDNRAWRTRDKVT